MYNNRLLYVEDTVNGIVTHYTFDSNWGEYLSHRKRVPGISRTFSTRKEMKEFLAQQGVLV